MRRLLSPVNQSRIVLPLLGFCVLFLLLILTSRWSWNDWTQPDDLSGDPLEVFARIKLAAEQPLQPFMGFAELDRLGAPFAGDWSAYPAPDSVVFFLTGQLARIVGIFAAAKIVAAFFYGLSAYSFYLCARHLRWRPEWAFTGALLFAFSNYNLRSAATLSLNQTFTLPPLVLLCGHAARMGPVPAGGHGGWLWLGGLLGAWLGLGNPYLGLFTGLVASATLGLALARRCPWARLAPLVYFLLALLGVFVLANFHYVLRYLSAGENVPLVRNYAGSLVYALKPLDWLIPPPEHRIPWAGVIGKSYFHQSQVMGTFFAGYLGAVGLAGLFGLLGVSMARLAKRPVRPVPHAMLGLVLITIFGVAGGFNSLLAFAGLDIFRASQRISIFANVWVLFFILGWLNHRLHRWPRWLTITAAAAIAVVGWWEQTPKLRMGGDRKRTAPQWEAARALTYGLEAELGAGAAIFQLPVRPFPEAGPLRGMADYEHFQPFLVDSSLRFSYGPMAGAPEFGWQRLVARLPAAERVPALEKSGFSAVWIDSRAYADQGEKLVSEFRAQERSEIPNETGSPIRIIRLRSAPAPMLPDLEDVRIHPAWSNDASDPASLPLRAVRGWYPLEQAGEESWRWARKRGEAAIWWPGGPSHATLKFRVAVLRNDTVELRHDGNILLRLPLSAGEMQRVEIPLRLSSGGNRLVWRIDGQPAYTRGNDSRKLGFMIGDLQVLPGSKD